MKYLFLFLFYASGFAQVGIGTTNPENDLHIAGSNSTIRIEGLNAANNYLNDDVRVPVYINSEGDFTLQNSVDNTNSLHFIVQSSDNLANSQVLVDSPSSTVETQTFPIYNEVINSESNTYVEIKYNFSYAVYKTYDESSQTGTVITDGESRVIKTYFTIDDDPTQYGQISQIYYNRHSAGGTGYFFNNGHGYIPLTQGTHTIRFFAEVTSASGTIVVVGGDQDSLKIRLYQ